MRRDRRLAGRTYVRGSGTGRGRAHVCDRSRIDAATLTKVCQAHGFTPNIVFEVENGGLIYSLLSSDRGIAFMPIVQMRKIHREYPDSGIHMVLLEDPVEERRLQAVFCIAETMTGPQRRGPLRPSCGSGWTLKRPRWRS